VGSVLKGFERVAHLRPAVLPGGDAAARHPVPEIARAFHLGLAEICAGAAAEIARREGLETVVLSGGVFQNRLLLEAVAQRLLGASLAVWTNREVPANDGGISLGQAALAVPR
jgi:hydrogenase maturation protein HypF